MSDNDNNDSEEKQKQKQRPNANYKLSNENANLREEEIVHYYNRERRLEKAPQSVRDLYKTQPTGRRFGLFGPLVKTKPLAIMFFSIIVICVVIVVLSALGLTGADYMLEGNNISIRALRFEGAIIMAVDKSTRKSSGLDRFSRPAPPYTGAVDIAVQPLLKDGEVRGEIPEDLFFHKIFFTFEPQEYYRFSIPFDTDELAVVLRTETKSLQLTVKAE
jgi:hypothetical protein